jgi:hypothetical protein
MINIFKADKVGHLYNDRNGERGANVRSQPQLPIPAGW